MQYILWIRQFKRRYPLNAEANPKFGTDRALLVDRRERGMTLIGSIDRGSKWEGNCGRAAEHARSADGIIGR